MKRCDIYWGSHGCDSDRDHDGLHWCRSCCEPMSPRHMSAHARAQAGDYGADGCAGSWPYYGEQNMGPSAEHDGLRFFRYSEDNGWEFDYLPDEFDRMRVIHEARIA